VSSGVLNLDPNFPRFSEYRTTDNVADIVTRVTGEGLQQAGFNTIPSGLSDVEVGCQITELAVLVGGTNWERNVQLAEAATVLLSGTGFVGSTSPRAGIMVDLAFQRDGRSFTRRLVTVDKSNWALSRRQGLEWAFEGALEKYQQKAVTETLKAVGIIAP